MTSPTRTFHGRFCAFLLLSATAAAFPADSWAKGKSKNGTDLQDAPFNGNASSSPSSKPQSSGVTVRTTLLPEDKKQFLSYVLGQPAKTAALKTPSHLMNPDKYEFYTFDDDGQIVKKLMSVQEIQRILANSERGQPHEPSNPIEYYQIITVSPDVEPPPAVSRINPSEPLFSVHDVIASVQNVLKSEINLKRGQGVSPRPDIVAVATNATASPTKPTTTLPKKDVHPTTTTTTTTSTTNADDTSETVEQTTIKVTTYRPKPPLNRTTSESATSAPTKVTTTTAEDISGITVGPKEESLPLSLFDAHPGLISNDETFFEPQASVIDQLPEILLRADVADVATTESPSTTQAATAAEDGADTAKPTIPERTINQVQIPMNQDLAESVSSVISQIASEISLEQFEGSLFSTESAALRTNAEDEDNIKKRTESVNIDDIYLTTEEPDATAVPATSATYYSGQLRDNATDAESDDRKNVIKPQNQPKPFEKEEQTAEDSTEKADGIPVQTTTAATLEESSVQSHRSNESDVQLLEAKEGDLLLNVSDAQESSTTPANLPSVPIEAVTINPEYAKPVPVKTTQVPVVKANQTIQGIKIAAEGNTGNIPRPTGSPDEIVKPTERSETTTEEKDDRDPAEARITKFFYETTTATAADPQLDAETTTAAPAESTSENSEPLADATEKSETPSTEANASPETRTEASAVDAIEEAESKILPENTSEVTTQAPTRGTTQKQQSLVVTVVEGEDIPGALKQNIPYKPFFGKPQKPVYIKPTRVKTPAEGKPSSKPKPSANREPAETKRPYESHFQTSPSAVELEAAPAENLGLEATSVHLDSDVKQFADLCNELAFSLWSSVTHGGVSFVRSVVVSPFAVTSLLAMVFLGARGPTSGQMNDVLKLDEMVTFNPHLVFRNVTESLVISRNPGVSTAAFVRELYSDKSKGKLLDFYKERAQQFYDGHVEEVNFKAISDTLRRQTNHLVKRQTWGKITDFLRGSTLHLRPPLAAFSANIFETDCTKASTKDRDGEMYFVVLPASRLRRLVPIPAVVWRGNFLAGYEPGLDATVVAVNPSDSAVSTVFVLPGQQGVIAPGDNLARLERQLLGSSFRRGHWSRLMKSLLPRPGLELQIPRFSHRSVINVTAPLQRMGLKDLFSAQKADLTGLNGLANDLHLSDMLQVNLFSTCGEDGIGSRHISEVYPATPLLRREKSSDSIFSESIENLFAVSDFEDPAISALPLELRPRQARIPLSKPGARIPEPPRLRFDRPFLFFVRHNPTGLVLHIGRFNPRLST